MNFTLIIAATVAQFILGALWYSPLLFGKWWMQIMECTHLSKAELQKLQKEMSPFYALQFFLTLITTWVLANNITYSGLSGAAVYYYAIFMWLGYMMPVSVSAVVWGNTKRRFWLKQIFVMLSMQLTGILLATFILTM